jgi:glycyl-tRNA synthetase beta chain
MPELFIELFSEEIPARMQARAAEDLARLLAEALAALGPSGVRTFCGPRRIAYAAEVAAGVAESRSSERGPRRSAPEQALAGFLRKHAATKEQLREEGDFWVLDRVVPGIDASALIAGSLPGLLRRFPWPKSMRWGGTSQFTWVRPLRRITCLLDGAVVAFDLRDGADDGHGLASGNLTEGHRFLSPGPVAVASCADWMEKLRVRHVIADAEDRRELIAQGLREATSGRGLAVMEDAGLLDEVAGLVEWPVPLLGAIDPAYMDLPPEVMQVSMRVNQRYFAVRDATGTAPFFAFAANMQAPDGGAAIIAGNERVLRARFADARHFWDLDRTRTLESRVAALDGVTFHAKLGSQGDRVRRLVGLARFLAPLVGADPGQAARAAELAKADLTTGMVGEFPELQGIMGGYYAIHDEEPAAVGEAVRDHYAPKGPSDTVPVDPVAVAVALADKLDLMSAFFWIGEKPTGSGDPFALRRAALGTIRIVRERGLRLSLVAVLEHEAGLLSKHFGELQKRALEERRKEAQRMGMPIGAQAVAVGTALTVMPATGLTVNVRTMELLDFLLERLRVQLRAEGARHDVLNAVLGSGTDDDFVRLLARTEAVAAMLGTEDGANLLAGFRRAANILRIEEKKDGPHDRPVDPALLEQAPEAALADALDRAEATAATRLAAEDFTAAMAGLAALRPFLDAFFNDVTVNDPRAALRRNRLALLARVRAVCGRVADFSKIEG